MNKIGIRGLMLCLLTAKVTVGLLTLLLSVPAILVGGYFLAAFTLLVTPLIGAAVLLACLFQNPDHWKHITFEPIENHDFKLIDIEKYIKKNQLEDDISLVG